VTERSDRYAREVLRAGRDLGITPRGIVIGFATVSVECDWIMYANAKVPESLDLPHERVGSDGKSVGLFQQQVVWGNGAWWWGDASDCMDPYRSARMFFQRLAKRNYTTGDAGSHAQAVQGSAFPDRYAERMGEAQQLYDRIANDTPNEDGNVAKPDFREINVMGKARSGRGGARVTNFLLHTQEGNGSAESLAAYLNNTNNGVSYHYTVRDGVVCDVVDTDSASWSVLSANSYTINLCFAGSRAAWSRQQWLDIERDLEIAAYLAVQDCRKYGFATDVITRPYRRADGISDHRYVTECLGIGNHTDVGDGFPWDVFARYVRKYTNGESEDDMQLTDEFVNYKGIRVSIKDLLWWLDRHASETAEQLGPWEQLGENDKGEPLRLVDAVAEVKSDVAAIKKLLEAKES